MSDVFSRESQVRADLRAGEPITDLPALIRVAIEDAREINRDEYVPWSSVWHRPDVIEDNEVCKVCFAGVVIADTLNTSRILCDPEDFGQHTSNALHALDHVRRGSLDFAMDNLTSSRNGTSAQKNKLDAKIGAHFLGFNDWISFDNALEELEVIADRIDEVLGLDKQQEEIRNEHQVPAGVAG